MTVPLVIRVAATFETAPFDEATAVTTAGQDVVVELHRAPYGHVVEQLADPASALREPADLHVVVLRPEDLPDPDTVAPEIRGRLERAAADGSSWLVVLPPASPTGPATMRARLHDALAGTPGLEVVALEPPPGTTVHDPHAEALAHIPYTDHGYRLVAETIVRQARVRRVPPRKVVVVDCDDTLWSGACGELGPTGVRVTPPFARVQRWLVDRAGEGVLVCLASRNHPDDVAATFVGNDGMLLGDAHLVGRRVSWDDKSRSLRSLADDLGVGLDSFVFLDDNAVERAEVRSVCPEVAVPELAADPEQRAADICSLWLFDTTGLTADDRGRVASYQAEARRRDLQSRTDDFAAFLAELDVRTEIAPVEHSTLDRAAQLTQRTNQFTTTGARWSAPELARRLAASDGTDALAVSVRDRLGEYGTVGLVLVAHDGDGAAVEGLWLSCRVLNRGVEEAIAADLLDRYGRLRWHLRTTTRNEPARAFVRRITVHGDPHALHIGAAGDSTAAPAAPGVPPAPAG